MGVNSKKYSLISIHCLSPFNFIVDADLVKRHLVAVAHARGYVLAGWINHKGVFF